MGHAFVCSSVVSSPANSSVGGGNTQMTGIDYEQRGAGDRSIPNRALSNFNFELSTGTGRSGRTGSSSVARYCVALVTKTLPQTLRHMEVTTMDEDTL